MKKTKISFNLAQLPMGIKAHCSNAAIYDSSCSKEAKTFLIQGTNNTRSAYLKISTKGSLERECNMTRFLNGHLVAPEVIAYETDEEHDYLLTEAVAGEDGVSGVHLENPTLLAIAFGKHLRRLHSLPVDSCPYPHRTAELIGAVKDKKNQLPFITQLQKVAVDDVIIHGDYCLPNIMMDHYTFTGFIDLGHGGIGDRHYDLYWGMWTLSHNLKTDRYHDVFLNAYGSTDVDRERLVHFARLVALTEG